MIVIMNMFRFWGFYIITSLALVALSCIINPVDSRQGVTGERILFIRHSRDFNEICTMNPDGSDINVISHIDYNDKTVGQGFMYAQWSPDKSKIVVQGGPGTTKETWPLWIMDMQGNLLYRLTNNGWTPLWRSDTEILFRRSRGSFFSRYDIYNYNLDTRKEEIIYVQEDTLSVTIKDISNDGKHALGLLSKAFFDSSGNSKWQNPTITEFEIGSWENYRELVIHDNISLSIPPKWSPDETLIAYALLNQSYVRNIYLMTAEGDSLFRLTNDSLINTHAYIFYDWSPDGQHFAYSKPDKSDEWNSYTNIFIIDNQSGMIEQLTDSGSDNIGNNVMSWR